jgi:cell wall assembly regulator SMI1
MQDIWNRIEAWLAANTPARVNRLHPGATEQELAKTEALYSVTFPDDVRELYRIHNGADMYGLFDDQFLFSLGDIRDV